MADKTCKGCSKQVAFDATECPSCQGTDFRAAGASKPGAGRGNDKESAEEAQTKAASDAVDAFLKSLTSPSAQRGNRVRTLALFGQSTSGKSWFLHRAKLDRHDFKFDEVVPLPTLHDKVLKTGVQIPGTIGIHWHEFRNSRNNVLRVADIEGEQFSQAFENRLEAAKSLRDFLVVLARADGYVFMLPAAETLSPDTAQKVLPGIDAPLETKRVNELLNSVRCVAAIAEMVRTQKLRDADIPDAMAKLVDRPGALEALLQKDFKTRRPALILLSKADEFRKVAQYAKSVSTNPEALGDIENEFDLDPMGALAKCSGDARALVPKFAKTFRQFRVDFVTACEGHVQFDAAGVRNFSLDRNLRALGVVDAMRWMKRAIEASKKDLALPTPDTSVLIAIRRLLDPNFDHALKSRS